MSDEANAQPVIPTADPLRTAIDAAAAKWEPPTGHVRPWAEWESQDDLRPYDTEAQVGLMMLFTGGKLALARLPGSWEAIPMLADDAGTWRPLSARNRSGAWTALTPFSSHWEEVGRKARRALTLAVPRVRDTWGCSIEEQGWWRKLDEKVKWAKLAAVGLAPGEDEGLPKVPPVPVLIRRCCEDLEYRFRADATRGGSWQGQVHRRIQVVTGSHNRRDEPLPGGPVECDIDDFDSDLSFIGHPGGVLRIELGKPVVLLTGAEARRALVSHRLPDRYDPEARHPDVDRLLAFPGIPPDVRDYFLDEIAYSFLRPPQPADTFVQGAEGRRQVGSSVSDPGRLRPVRPDRSPRGV